MNSRISIGVLVILIICAGCINQAYAISSNIVISQAYIGANEDGTRLVNKYIELFNLGTTAVDIAGWSIQYAPGTGSTWTSIPLSGTIRPGQYYLIADGFIPETFSGVPRPDLSATVRLDLNSGRIALMDNTTLVGVTTCPSTAIDVVTYGITSCNGAAPTPEVVNALMRKDGGCREVDDNRAEFSATFPIPHNSSSPRNPCPAGSPVNSRTFATANRGGISVLSGGTLSALTTGYARIQPESGSTTPGGIAVFGLRQAGILVTEASVPASPLIQSALIYMAVSGSVNTGIAIANPNNEDVGVSFSVRDLSNGLIRQSGTTTVPAKGQLARFANEWPFSVSGPVEGTILITTTLPVGITALRGFTNERGEFLITTLPVIDRATNLPTSDTAYLPHFATGVGWKSEIILVNTSSQNVTGSIEFWGPTGQPVSVRVGGTTSATFTYSVLAQAAQRFTLSETGSTIQTGSVRIVPASGSSTPVPLEVFSYVRGGVTVAQAGVNAGRGNAFRMYAELSGNAGSTGNIQAGFAIANIDPSPAQVEVTLTQLDGTPAASPVTVTIPGSGQVGTFLNELFPGLARPFQGIVRLSTTNVISVTGLRFRYNERNDFLFTTTPAINEAVPAGSAELVFPHLVDSGGYTTQFILFSGAADQTSAGTLRMFTLGGQAVDIGLH